MNPKGNGVIQRKLALLDTQVANLELHLRGVSRSRFVGDWALRSMAERALQVSAEILIDVAERIIALKGAGPVASAVEAMERLAQLGVIESPQIYAEIVRFRNMIVHQYQDVDPGLVFDLATSRLGDFRRFRDEIDRASL